MTSNATASAPASSANLGPGFDTLAIALELRCTATAQNSDNWVVEHVGKHRPEPSEMDAVLMGARMAVGDERPLRIRVENQIPIGNGLGSSSAAFVAGVAVALRQADGGWNPGHVFRVAAELDGHPDNVAAAVYGGLVLVPAEGEPMRLPINPLLQPVVAVPEAKLSTRVARSVLPLSYQRDVVVRSVGRVAALTAGLLTADPDLLRAAHGDEIHELPRADMSPEVEKLIRVAKGAGALHAARSGAGPSVVAFVSGDAVQDVVRAFEDQGVDVVQAGVATSGLI